MKIGRRVIIWIPAIVGLVLTGLMIRSWFQFHVYCYAPTYDKKWCVAVTEGRLQLFGRFNDGEASDFGTGSYHMMDFRMLTAKWWFEWDRGLFYVPLWVLAGLCFVISAGTATGWRFLRNKLGSS